MVGGEYSPDNYKSLKRIIGEIIKNLEMLRFKNKKMCKHAVKKLLLVVRYVPDQYKTQKLCDKAIA